MRLNKNSMNYFLNGLSTVHVNLFIIQIVREGKRKLRTVASKYSYKLCHTSNCWLTRLKLKRNNPRKMKHLIKEKKAGPRIILIYSCRSRGTKIKISSRLWTIQKFTTLSTLSSVFSILIRRTKDPTNLNLLC